MRVGVAVGPGVAVGAGAVGVEVEVGSGAVGVLVGVTVGSKRKELSEPQPTLPNPRLSKSMKK